MEKGSLPEPTYRLFENRDINSLAAIMEGTGDPHTLGRIVATLNDILRRDPGDIPALALIGIVNEKFELCTKIEELRAFNLEEARLFSQLKDDSPPHGESAAQE